MPCYKMDFDFEEKWEKRSKREQQNVAQMWYIYLQNFKGMWFS